MSAELLTESMIIVTFNLKQSGALRVRYIGYISDGTELSYHGVYGFEFPSCNHSLRPGRSS